MSLLESFSDVAGGAMEAVTNTLGAAFDVMQQGEIGRMVDLGFAEAGNALFNENAYTPYGEAQMSPEIEPPAAPAQTMEPMQAEIQPMEMELN